MRIPYCVLRRGRRDVYVPRMQTVRKVLVSNGIYNRRSRKNVRFVRFTPPPLEYYTKENVLVAFAEAVVAGRRPGSATGSGSAGCLHDRHYTTHLYWCAAGFTGGGASQNGGEFLATSGELYWSLSPLLWTTPNLGCTLTGRIADHWGDLPDHWRLRPGRWVWPHLTDNQLACTHNQPGYTCKKDPLEDSNQCAIVCQFRKETETFERLSGSRVHRWTTTIA